MARLAIKAEVDGCESPKASRKRELSSRSSRTSILPQEWNVESAIKTQSVISSALKAPDILR